MPANYQLPHFTNLLILLINIIIIRWSPTKTQISQRHLPSRCPEKCHSRSVVALSSPEVGTWLAWCSACPCNDAMLWCSDVCSQGASQFGGHMMFFSQKSVFTAYCLVNKSCYRTCTLSPKPPYLQVGIANAESKTLRNWQTTQF